MHVRTNDTVLVIKGRDRGKQGKVQRVLPREGLVLVEGVNLAKRHTKARAGIRQAGIIQKEMPLRAANVQLICVKCAKPTRVGSKRLTDGTGVRICLQCKETVE
jgi:large subunit ribosomal protein L24